MKLKLIGYPTQKNLEQLITTPAFEYIKQY